MSIPVNIVTGANRGVGLAIAEAIAALSTPQILYAGSRAGKDLALAKGSQETSIHYVKLDISDSASIEALAARIKQDGGRVDRLINNAGVNLNYEKDLSGKEKVKQTLDINYRGTLEVTRAFLPLMQKDSRIVHLSSVASHLNKFSSSLAERYRSASSIADVDSLVAEFEQASQDGSAKSGGWPDPYSVSKASINAMTRIQAKENPDIKINCCCPGWCSSDMGGLLGQPPKTPREGARIPLKLAVGDIENVSGEFWEEPSISSKGEGRVSSW